MRSATALSLYSTDYYSIQLTATMSLANRQQPMATSAAAAPGLLQQVGMAGSAAVITVSFIHPIDVVKVSLAEKVDGDARPALKTTKVSETVG